jgi:putative glycosyltransferase (TIGR04372 family)
MKIHNTDPVREARRLFSAAQQEVNHDNILNYATNLRSIGRIDLALEILELLIRADGLTRERLFEKTLCLKDAGYNAEANEAMAALKRLSQHDFEVILLELGMALQLGGRAIAEFSFGELSQSVREKSQIQKMLLNLPWSLISLRNFLPILKSVAAVMPSRFISALLQYSYAKIKVDTSKLITSLVNRTLCLITGKNEIIFSSMGKFTRLADLVDQVDSLLRRLTIEGRLEDVKVYLFFFGGYPNKTMYKKYGEQCKFINTSNRILRKIALYYIALLKLSCRYTEVTVDYRKINTYFMSGPPVIGFGSIESAGLERDLERIGIDSCKPFICMGLRDMAYYQFYGEVMNNPLSSQGKRSETHHRCPPLESYIEFAKYWASRGYQVVRMGLRASERLPVSLDPLIIDYAFGERSDELDAFLMSRCHFLTAGDTGLFSGAAAFDRPAVVSDLFLIRNTIYSSNKKTHNIFVPKLIYDERENRYINFREQIHFNHYFSYFGDCESAEFRIVHNAPEDIIDASVELVERLSGNHSSSAEDNELQVAFQKIYLPSYVGYASTGIISSRFLRKYSHLLN